MVLREWSRGREEGYEESCPLLQTCCGSRRYRRFIQSCHLLQTRHRSGEESSASLQTCCCGSSSHSERWFQRYLFLLPFLLLLLLWGRGGRTRPTTSTNI